MDVGTCLFTDRWQPGSPTAILGLPGLPCPCTEQPVWMKAAALQVSAPAESSRLLVSGSGTACSAALGHPGSAPCPPLWWLVAAVPLCGPHGRSTQTCPTTPCGIYSCRDRWRGNNEHHSGLICSYWHTSTLSIGKMVAWGNVLQKTPSKGLDSSPCPGVPLGGTQSCCSAWFFLSMKCSEQK